MLIEAGQTAKKVRNVKAKSHIWPPWVTQDFTKISRFSKPSKRIQPIEVDFLNHAKNYVLFKLLGNYPIIRDV